MALINSGEPDDVPDKDSIENKMPFILFISLKVILKANIVEFLD
jgi:hypothetical protein